jgi:hypothetical protein
MESAFVRHIAMAWEGCLFVGCPSVHGWQELSGETGRDQQEYLLIQFIFCHEEKAALN